MAYTQQQKIVAIMCINKDKRWWKAQDIMNIGSQDLFVGYEASARLSELATDHPSMIETRRSGKYYERRMKFETGSQWFRGLPKSLQDVIRKYYKKDEPAHAVYVGLE